MSIDSRNFPPEHKQHIKLSFAVEKNGLSSELEILKGDIETGFEKEDHLGRIEELKNKIRKLKEYFSQIREMFSDSEVQQHEEDIAKLEKGMTEVESLVS